VFGHAEKLILVNNVLDILFDDVTIKWIGASTFFINGIVETIKAWVTIRTVCFSIREVSNKYHLIIGMSDKETGMAQSKSCKFEINPILITCFSILFINFVVIIFINSQLKIVDNLDNLIGIEWLRIIPNI
jgi:hypothetical protein